MGVSTQGKDVGAQEGVDYDVFQIADANEAEDIFTIGTETSSIVLRAPSGNSGPIYIGFDDNVTTSDGFPIPADTGISIDIDVSQQAIFAVSGNVGDELRYLAIR